MKVCPTCNRSYSDDTISFCLEDGTVLSAASNAQPTQPYPPSRHTEPPATQIMPPSPPSAATILAPPPTVRGDKQSYPVQPVRNRWPLIAGAVILAVFVGLVIIVVAGFWVVNRDSLAGKQPSDSGVSRDATPKSDASPTPQNSRTTVVPEPPTPSEQQLQMSGTWVGTFDEYPARLIITDHEGESFTGTLTGKTFEIIVEGTLNSATRAIYFKETRVVRDKSWVLGANAGLMSPDGRRISGKGTASGSYSWTFSKV